jgi:adenosylhomocysteinase
MRSFIFAEGVKAEALYKKDGTLPDPTSTDNPEFKIVLSIIKEGLSKSADRWTTLSKSLVGESVKPSIPPLSHIYLSTCVCFV